MSDWRDRDTKWELPPEFECIACGKKEHGTIAASPFGFDGSGPGTPPGWLRRWSGKLRKTIYACSLECADKNMPHGAGRTGGSSE